ncbi:hypothetical protein [uncultured Hymenobacter sp.]|uniref:hypothetical protein n=1 Tax=uncultured Hymenobacter sp. TaxID=170016 RepID=UPI0035CAD439
MTTTTVGRRFTQLINHLGMSKNAFAQSLGKTATVVQHLVEERNKPGYDLLCKVFEVYPAVSKDWLLLGQGPMLTDFPTPPPGVIPAPPPVEARQAGKTPAAISPDPAPAPPPASALASEADPLPAAPNAGVSEALLSGALHAQHLQHQLALAEQRNQHLLEQQRLMQQLLELAQRR